jgi:hypothetical protein
VICRDRPVVYMCLSGISFFCLGARVHQLWLFCFVKRQRENEEIESLYSLMFEIVGTELLKG